MHTSWTKQILHTSLYFGSVNHHFQFLLSFPLLLLGHSIHYHLACNLLLPYWIFQIASFTCRSLIIFSTFVLIWSATLLILFNMGYALAKKKKINKNKVFKSNILIWLKTQKIRKEGIHCQTRMNPQ